MRESNGCVSSGKPPDPESGCVWIASKGAMAQPVIVECGAVLRDRLTIDRYEKLLVFSVFVEMAQNIAQHSADRVPGSNGGTGIGTLEILQLANSVCFTAANRIESSAVSRLQAHLAWVAGVDRKDLDVIYRDTLHKKIRGPFGQGLGLLEIARRANGGIQFEFSEVGPKFFLFSLQAEIELCPDASES